MKKTGLGRGLDALLPESNDLENTVSMIAVTELDRNPDQPRRDFDEASLQALADSIRQAGVLITDFSSIYMDFAYMKKPVLYYQFDTEQFRQGHLPLGYFDYERDGFGPICADEESLLAAVEDCFADGCRMAPLYEERVDRFYTIHDDKNCERTYRAILKTLAGREEVGR